MMWAVPPATDADVQRRTATLHKLSLTARGLDDDGYYDEYGRVILMGYEAVSGFIDAGMNA